MPNEVLETLQQTKLFKHFPEEKLQNLCTQIKIESYSANELIVRENEFGDNVYIIMEGAVRVFTTDQNNEEIVLIRLEKGDFFGEQALLTAKPMRRNASIKALTNVKLVAISHLAFQQTIQANTELLKLLKVEGKTQLVKKLELQLQERGAEESGLNKLLNHSKHFINRRIYKVPAFGTMMQYQGNFLDQPTIQTTIQKNTHETIVASHIINANIFAISYANTDKAISFLFEDTPDHVREIRLLNNQLVSVVSIGNWDDLEEVCRLIYEKPAMTPDILAEFSKTGKVSSKSSMQGCQEGNLCECMQVKYQTVQTLIKKGIATQDSISQKTGAGTMCGGCKPRIAELLGGEVWTYAKIINIIHHNDHVRSYQLQPLNRKVASYFAGQHIVVEANIDSHWIARTYTLTSTDTEKKYYEITVQREPQGLFSRWLFDHGKINMVLRLAEPKGSFIFYPEKIKPAVCFMGGIGITPAIAFARKLISDQTQRPLHIDYSVESINDISFKDEIKAWPQQHPNVSTHIRVTNDHGLITENDIVKIHKIHPNADYFICGPESFEKCLAQHLKNVGIEEERIHLELFTHAGGPVNLD